MNRVLLEKEDHPEPLTWIARAKLSTGHLDDAKELFEKAIASDGLESAERVSILGSLSEIDSYSGRVGTGQPQFCGRRLR